MSLKSVENAVLQKLLDISGGQVMEASRRTGIAKDRFYRLQKQ